MASTEKTQIAIACLLSLFLLGCDTGLAENMENGMEKEVAQLLGQLYPDFNDRNIEQIMPHFAADADWPNGMTGGREIGHAAIREYWTNQWKVIDSKVTPISYRVVDGKIILEVHQLVKDMEGRLLSDSVVFHTYKFIESKIQSMDISEDDPEFGVAKTTISE